MHRTPAFLAITIAIACACNNPSKLDGAPAAGSGSPGSPGASAGSSAAPTMPTVRHYKPDRNIVPAPPTVVPKLEAFVVLDAGKGPKAPLRYALADGAVEHQLETRLSSRQIERGKFTDPVRVPPIRDGF